MLEAGGSYTPDGETAGLGRSWSFYGGASVSRSVRRNRLSAFYRREVLPLFGLGRLGVADRFGLSASIPWGRRWAAGLSASYAREAASSVEGDRAGAFDTSATVGVQVARRFRLSAEGRYLKRSVYGPYPAADALRAGIFLTLTPPRGAGR